MGWAWAIYVLAAIAIGLGLEAYALVRNKLTFSRATWRSTLAWGPLPFVAGLIIGGLAVHFWWHWCPELGSINGFRLIAPAAAAERSLILPDPALTPGVATDITAEKLCDKKFTTRDVRSVTAKMKREVFARYGLTGNKDKACKPDKHGRRCEVDHLISLELGGANDIENLWPEPFGTTPWNAQIKDKVENKLHHEVCAGNITLEQAQHDILDYRIPYIRYFGEPQ